MGCQFEIFVLALSLRFRTVKEDGKEDGVDDLGINPKLESL